MDRYNGIKDSKVVKFLKNRYFLVTLVFVIVLFLDTNNLTRWYNTAKDVVAQEKQKEYYRKAIHDTEEQLKELQSNRDSLEKFAREQYYFHEADEEIFIVK